MTRKDCLHMAETCVYGERELDYGTPEDNFTTIANLWEDYLNESSNVQERHIDISAKDVAVMMMLLKIARIASSQGQPTADCFIDICGYAACGCEISSSSLYLNTFHNTSDDLNLENNVSTISKEDEYA